MITRQRFKIIGLLATLFIITGLLPAHAQDFKWQDELPYPDSTGFYNILLSPGLIAESRDTALADIRIFEGDKPVPYILFSDTPYVRFRSDLRFSEEGSRKQTVINMVYLQENVIQRLQFFVDSPTFYRREVHIRQRINGKMYGHSSFIISSEQPIITFPETLKGMILEIVIENEGNPPLKVSKIDAFQKCYYLTAWLEKGKKYLLKTGNVTIDAPIYDLPYFKDKLPHRIPVIVPLGNIYPVHTVMRNILTDGLDKRPALFKGKAWIWAGIIGILVLISLLTVRLLREMRERK